MIRIIVFLRVHKETILLGKLPCPHPMKMRMLPFNPKPINPNRFFLGLLEKKVGHHRIFCAGSL